MIGGVDFNGQTTYRLYLEMQNESDFLSCISGEADNPMMILSTSTPAWYNDTELGEEIERGSTQRSCRFSRIELRQLVNNRWRNSRR